MQCGKLWTCVDDALATAECDDALLEMKVTQAREGIAGERRSQVCEAGDVELPEVLRWQLAKAELVERFHVTGKPAQEGRHLGVELLDVPGRRAGEQGAEPPAIQERLDGQRLDVVHCEPPDADAGGKRRLGAAEELLPQFAGGGHRLRRLGAAADVVGAGVEVDCAGGVPERAPPPGEHAGGCAGTKKRMRRRSSSGRLDRLSASAATASCWRWRRRRLAIVIDMYASI